MYLIVTASADTYITDKIVDSSKKTSANVGRAGTLDIFKLYDESTVITGAVETSRALLGFDYSRLSALTSSTLDLSNFRAVLRLFSVNTGQPVPSDFTLSLFPLNTSFSEGLGRDIVSFADVDSANYLSSSDNTLWYVSGANNGGLLGSNDIDYIASGNLSDGNGLRSFETKQVFTLGTEDLALDITDYVSASIAGQIPTSAFRLAFTGSQESDNVTRFVKRFASRHVKNTMLRPRIEVFWDDSRVDDRLFASFNLSGTLYISNNLRGSRANLVSGSSLTPVVGNNCVLLRLSTGSYSAYFTGSQDVVNNPVTGVYKSSFVIASSDSGIVSGSTKLSDHITASGSVTFDEVWSSLDETVIFRNGSITLQNEQAFAGVYDHENLTVRSSGPQTAPPNTRVLVRSRFFDLSLEDYSVKIPFTRKPVPVIGTYRVVDSQSSQVYVDFDTMGTKLSLDEQGNFFEFYSDSVPLGRPVKFEYKVNYNGRERIISDPAYTFKLGN